MKSYSIAVLLAVSFSGAIMGQSGKKAIDTHVAVAKAAARQEHTSLFGLCRTPEPAPAVRLLRDPPRRHTDRNDSFDRRVRREPHTFDPV